MYELGFAKTNATNMLAMRPTFSLAEGLTVYQHNCFSTTLQTICWFHHKNKPVWLAEEQHGLASILAKDEPVC